MVHNAGGLVVSGKRRAPELACASETSNDGAWLRKGDAERWHCGSTGYLFAFMEKGFQRIVHLALLFNNVIHKVLEINMLISGH